MAKIKTTVRVAGRDYTLVGEDSSVGGKGGGIVYFFYCGLQFLKTLAGF